jgi:flavin-dependent dehydrogenase
LAVFKQEPRAIVDAHVLALGLSLKANELSIIYRLQSSISITGGLSSMNTQNNIKRQDGFQASNSRPLHYDVVIIGGGPAGSTVATLLTKWGRKVLVLEKERFPRHHIGESLLAGTTTLMKELGVYEKVEQADFVHKFGATYIWGKSEEPWSILFSEVSDESRYSFQVERSKYDKILLDHAREMDANILEACRVTRFLRDNERIIGVEYLDAVQEAHSVYAQYCVDASGQSALLGSAYKLRKFNQTLRNFALYAYYRGGKSTNELISSLRPQDAGNIFVVAMEKGWIWYIPLGDSRYSVGVVTHASLAKELNKENRFQFYQDCLNATPQIKYLLSDATIESTNLYTQSDWSYICDSFQGPGYVMVGDAACFVDPILSTGVDLAMEGAFKAAIAINTSLTTPELTEQAMQWYEEEYKTKAGHFLQMAEHWYHGHRNRDDWFWKAKQLVDPASNLSIRQTFILLTGGFTTGSSGKDLPALKSFGGFRPFQLRTIYQNLDCGTEISEREQSATPSAITATMQPDNDFFFEKLTEQQLRFQDKISYRTSMIEQDDRLHPIIRVEQDIEGVPLTRLVLPTTSLPLLERLNGESTVQEIITDTINSSLTQGNRTNDQEKMLAILREMYQQRLLIAV